MSTKANARYVLTSFKVNVDIFIDILDIFVLIRSNGEVLTIGR